MFWGMICSIDMKVAPRFDTKVLQRWFDLDFLSNINDLGFPSRLPIFVKYDSSLWDPWTHEIFWLGCKWFKMLMNSLGLARLQLVLNLAQLKDELSSKIFLSLAHKCAKPKQGWITETKGSSYMSWARTWYVKLGLSSSQLQAAFLYTELSLRVLGSAWAVCTLFSWDMKSSTLKTSQ